MTEWQPVETAPKGVTSKYVTDKKYKAPPKILLLCPDGEIICGYWEYYHEPTVGYGANEYSPWVENMTGEQIEPHCGEPTYWLPLPDLPKHEEK